MYIDFGPQVISSLGINLFPTHQAIKMTAKDHTITPEYNPDEVDPRAGVSRERKPSVTERNIYFVEKSEKTIEFWLI